MPCRVIFLKTRYASRSSDGSRHGTQIIEPSIGRLEDVSYHMSKPMWSQSRHGPLLRHLRTLPHLLLRQGIIDDPYAEYFYLGSTVVWLMGHNACIWLSDMMVPGAHEMLIARTSKKFVKV